MLSLFLASLLGALSLLHIYWFLGGRWGYASAIPEVNGQLLFQAGGSRAGRVLAYLIPVLLTLAALLVLMQGHWIKHLLPSAWVSYSIWLLAAIFLIRAIGDFRYVGFAKRVKGTNFAVRDTFLYSPLCLLLAVGCVLLQLLA